MPPELERAFGSAARLAHEREQLSNALKGIRLESQASSGGIERTTNALAPLRVPSASQARPQSPSRGSSESSILASQPGTAEATPIHRQRSSEEKHALALVQKEVIELRHENAQLRRRQAEMERDLQMARERAKWMAQRSNGGPPARSSMPISAPPAGHSVRPTTSTGGGGRSRPQQTPTAPSTARRSAVACGGNCQPTAAQIVAAAEAGRAEARAVGASLDDGRDSGGSPHETWSVSGWLASLRTLTVLAEAILRPVGGATQGRGGSQLELAFVRALARTASRDAMRELLLAGGVLDEIADEMWRGSRKLIEGAAATPIELHAKFAQESEVFTIEFGGLGHFYSGLTGLIGAPDPNLHEAVRREHCESADSHSSFEAVNYGTATTSAIEYTFVTRPEGGLRKLNLEAWPQETKLDTTRRRQPTPLSSFRRELKRANSRLKKLACAPVGDDELVCARLYTGPLFQKVRTTRACHRMLEPPASVRAHASEERSANRGWCAPRLRCHSLSLSTPRMHSEAASQIRVAPAFAATPPRARATVQFGSPRQEEQVFEAVCSVVCELQGQSVHDHPAHHQFGHLQAQPADDRVDSLARRERWRAPTRILAAE